jgi:hypothetical protein
MNPTARRENVYVEKLADETILYDKVNHQAHCLNATVATVWEHADGIRTVDDLAQILNDKLGIPMDCQAVLLSIEQLENSGLMETSQSTTASTDLRSRRHMARDLAMAGLSASLLPLVASVLAPTPAMAASASGPTTISSYKHDVSTVVNDIGTHFTAFSKSPTALSDFNAGINAGNQGIIAAQHGNNALAQSDFQSAISDFDGTLKALGLGPL